MDAGYDVSREAELDEGDQVPEREMTVLGRRRGIGDIGALRHRTRRSRLGHGDGDTENRIFLAVDIGLADSEGIRIDGIQFIDITVNRAREHRILSALRGGIILRIITAIRQLVKHPETVVGTPNHRGTGTGLVHVQMGPGGETRYHGMGFAALQFGAVQGHHRPGIIDFHPAFRIGYRGFLAAREDHQGTDQAPQKIPRLHSRSNISSSNTGAPKGFWGVTE